MADCVESETRSERMSPRRKANILLVDDQPANLLVLRAVLEDLDGTLVEVNSGEEAVRRVQMTEFAVVLLDVQMPGLDGFEAAKLIREIDQSRRTPIIFLTAYEDDRFPVERAYSLGAVDYLTKPVVPAVLKAKVAGFVELFEKTEQVKRQAERIQQMERQSFEQKLADENARLRSSEARKAAILETALDCIVSMDHEGRIVEFNPASEKTFGYRRDQVIGKELAEVIIPPSLRSRHRQGMAHYFATGEGPVLNQRLELPALRADGTEFPVELAITRISSGGPPQFTAYLRDISARVKLEGRRNARLAVTQILAQASTVDEVANGILSAICENLGWDLGFFWKLERESDTLRCFESWHKTGRAMTEFEVVSRTRTFVRGEGLPGRLWATGKPAWILDVVRDNNFPRVAPAAKEGLHSAFGCPILVAGETLGVIEFFCERILETDADLLEMMATIAGQIGQFMERKRAENEVRRSEQELTDFFENATIGLHWVGPDGIILRANKAELDLLGYSPEEYVGRPIADFHVDNDVICDILNRLSAGEKLHEYSARLRCKDGSIKDVLIDSSVKWEGGKFVHTRCFTRDVTERKIAEAKLREQEQHAQTILESITDAFCALDRDWRFVYVNHQAEVLMGRNRNDLLGKSHWDVYSDTLGTDLERNLRRAMAEKVTVTFEFYYPPKDRWYEVHAYPSPDGISIYFRDASERRRAEAAVRESEGKLRLLADTIPQLAWMARPDGHIFWYNRRWYEYTGTTPVQMEGWGWQSVHDPAVLPKVLEQWKGSLASGEPFEMVFPLKGTDDKFHPFLTRVNPLRDDEGRVLHWFGTNTDISEIKKMEEALRDADRRKDEFLATLAHELRNPLAPIRNSLQILKMPRVDVATAQQTRDMMERQVHHLVRLVDDLMDVSRVMRGKIELRKEQVELATVIARAVETAQPLIELQGHRLQIALPPDSLLLDADPVRLTQVVGNLLTNAAKYTEANGNIWVTAERERNHAVLRIRDNGIGIAPDMLPHIFELFVQVDHAATRSQGGLGIGLTLVKNLVEMHQGNVAAHSDGLGRGSEFVVRLPLASSAQTQSKSDDATQPSLPTSGNRLLVVDDNTDAAESLALLLRLKGHQVRVAHNGLSALDIVSNYRPQIVLLDIGMPGMDGYEVARRIRKQPGLESVVLAALTGWGQQEDRRRSADAGFDHHLVKPVDPNDLMTLLAGLFP